MQKFIRDMKNDSTVKRSDVKLKGNEVKLRNVT